MALALLGLGVAAGTVGAAHRQLDAPRAFDALGLVLALVPVAALGLVLRRGTAAVAGAALGVAGLAAYLLLGYAFGPVFLPVVLTVLGSAAAGRRWLAWSTAGAMAAAGVAAAAARWPGAGPGLVLGVLPWLAVLLLLGEGLRIRLERREAARVARAAAVESAVAAERLAIARDVHDVVAHSLSAIAVQAGVGLHLLDDDPQQARASLQAVKDTSKQALDDVRGVIQALRQDGEAPSHRPTPGLADLGTLVEQARTTGLAVEAELPTASDAVAVPRAVGGAAYRLVQEALTNARRHAARPEARVAVAVAPPGVLTVEVRSPLAPRPAAEPARPGHGVVGMRERVLALGGVFSAGAVGESFVVRAEIGWGAR